MSLRLDGAAEANGCFGACGHEQNLIVFVRDFSRFRASGPARDQTLFGT
jgi:hypothetical protein